jgi:hypothetical protein
MTATTATNAVDRFLAAVEGAGIPDCDAWSDDAFVDATVPNWRMTLRGPDAIRAEYGRWFADPGRFEELRRIPIAEGEVVEYLLTWEEQGVAHAAHHVHILHVDDNRITADTVMCGGRWPAPLMAEIAAADT